MQLLVWKMVRLNLFFLKDKFLHLEKVYSLKVIL